MMQKSQRGVREKIYSGSKKNKNKKKLRKLLKWKLEGCPGILSDQSKSHFGRLDRMPNRKYDKRVGGGGGAFVVKSEKSSSNFQFPICSVGWKSSEGKRPNQRQNGQLLLSGFLKRELPW